jgi:error-prone DNA polymerase
MMANGIEPDYAERIFSQIRGFGEYGFPESHAASFALLATRRRTCAATSRAEFLCAMLNAQPMGFYSTLDAHRGRQAARRRAAAHRSSRERVGLHARAHADGTCRAHGPAVREGPRRARACAHRGGEGVLSRPRVVRARHAAPLNQYVRLAEAGAFDGIGLSRRDALWRVRGLVSEAGDDVVLERLHGTTTFRALDTHDAVKWDHEVTFHSTRGHPMQRFRELLRSMHVPDSSEVRAMKDATRTDYVGMVICRQRPGTASGVTFFTLEDEVGFVNLVVWVRVFEQYERIARTAGLLGVHGLIQSKDGVVHLIAEKLWVPGLEGGALMGSRDFH